LKHINFSLIQDEGSVFKRRECAQSIPRINLPPESHFQAENLTIFASIHTPIPGVCINRVNKKFQLKQIILPGSIEICLSTRLIKPLENSKIISLPVL
jgi:hypothetical protein